MVSIIIPCYNCESFVHRAIASVIGQTYREWELLLVNNNSVDGTQQVLESYQQQNPEKIFFFQEGKKGAPAARNKGLSYAKGKWVQYLDADDELLPEKLEQQVQLAESEGADCIVGNATLVELKGGKLQHNLRPLYKTDVWIGLITSQLGITSALLWKKEILDSIQGWNEELTSSQEYDMMFRMMKSGGKVVIDERVKTLIYKTDSTISKDADRSKMVRIIDNRVKLRLQILEHLKTINELTEARRAMIHRYIYLELYGNKIDIKEYQSTKLNGLALEIPLKLRLSNTLKDIRKSIKSSLKSLLSGKAKLAAE
jgi:glycosyltransferase involved in cell wall biosynthesis